MITELNSSYYIGSNYLKAAKLCGLSTDTKPTNVGNGSTLKEIDTGKTYMFDAVGKTWYEQTSSGGGGGGGDDSSVMIVHVAKVTASGNTSLVPDAEFEDVMAAHEAGKLIVMEYMNSSASAIATYNEEDEGFHFELQFFYNGDFHMFDCLWSPNFGEFPNIEYYDYIIATDEQTT